MAGNDWQPCGETWWLETSMAYSMSYVPSLNIYTPTRAFFRTRFSLQLLISQLPVVFRRGALLVSLECFPTLWKKERRNALMCEKKMEERLQTCLCKYETMCNTDSTKYLNNWPSTIPPRGFYTTRVYIKFSFVSCVHLNFVRISCISALFNAWALWTTLSL